MEKDYNKEELPITNNGVKWFFIITIASIVIYMGIFLACAWHANG